MTQNSAEDRRTQLQQAIDEYMDLRSRGGDVSINAFAAERTQLLPELEVELERLERVRGAWQQAQRPPSESAATLSLAAPQEDSMPITGLRIRCAYCRTPVNIHDNTSLCHITCSRCGGAFSIVEVDERFQPGVMLGQFRLVEELGSGGFGTVWQADDTELDRSVAVKIPLRGRIDPQEVEQFLREARTAAQLQHPGIVSIHEVGRAEDTVYIVSELVEGTTLGEWQPKGEPVEPRRAAEMCRRIANALHYAHGRGVVHRDLKPQNIMVDAAGEPHLMDFGLARRASGETTVTKDGNVLGTPAYMSPEQARGESHHVDARTDVYSLGVILFQLLTGRLPFRGDTSKLLYQVIHNQSPRPRSLHAGVPRDLETICLKCLEKEPDRRYASAEEVADDLDRYLAGQPIMARPVSRAERTWRWCKRNPGLAAMATAVLVLVAALGVVGLWPGKGPAPVVDSVAILVHAAADEESPSLRAFLSRSLSDRFADLPSLAVATRADVLRYEDRRNVEPDEVARELGVDGILVGEVDQNGEEFRLQLRLIAEHDDRLLWEHDYPSQPVGRLPGVEHGIVQKVVREIGLELTGEEESQLQRNPQISEEAYAAYIRGKQLLFQNTDAMLQQAEREFRKAIELEEGFAEAHAGLAEAYFSLAYMYRRPDEYYDKAARAVETAVEIDPSQIDARVIKGAIDYFCHWNWDEGEKALKMALDFDPTLIERNYCYLHMLDAMGRAEEAVRLVDSALLRQPSSELLRVEKACSLYYAHRFEESRQAIQDVLNALTSPMPYYHWHLARALNQLGREQPALYDTAIAASNVALEGEPWSAIYVEIGYAYAMNGNREGALSMIRKLDEIAAERDERGSAQYVDPYEYAMIYAGLAEKALNDASPQEYEGYVTEIIERLTNAAAMKSAWLPSMNTDPKFNFLRDGPKFQKLLKEIGFHEWSPPAEKTKKPAA